jgi:hypothetical protein
MEAIDQDTYLSEQILAADSVYAVFYKDSPINIKTVNTLVTAPIKYKKTSFQNPGYAINLAKRLNDKFQTEDFVVRIMDGGTVYNGMPKNDFYDE